MELTIDYCADCGHLDKAVEAARDVLDQHADDLERVELVPSEDGVFRISVDSEVVFDIDQDEFSVSDITDAVEENIEGSQGER